MQQKPPHKTEMQQVLELLQKIEKNTRPTPTWIRSIDWVFNHALRIILYVILAFFAWKAYTLAQNFTQSVEQKLEWQNNLQQNIGEKMDGLSLENFKLW